MCWVFGPNVDLEPVFEPVTEVHGGNLESDDEEARVMVRGTNVALAKFRRTKCPLANDFHNATSITICKWSHW